MLPFCCAPAQTLGTIKRIVRNWGRNSPRSSPSSKENASKSLWRVENRASAGHAPRRGPTRGETRGEGAEAARRRCGGERAPSGELGDAERRAGTSSVTRLACRDGSNEARQQRKRPRRGMRARGEKPAGREAVGSRPGTRGLQGDIGFMDWRRARRGIRRAGGEGIRRERSI